MYTGTQNAGCLLNDVLKTLSQYFQYDKRSRVKAIEHHYNSTNFVQYKLSTNSIAGFGSCATLNAIDITNANTKEMMHFWPWASLNAKLNWCTIFESTLCNVLCGCWILQYCHTNVV